MLQKLLKFQGLKWIYKILHFTLSVSLKFALTTDVSAIEKLYTLARPKSASLTCPELVTRTFCGFRSLCAIRWECKKSTPFKIWCIKSCKYSIILLLYCLFEYAFILKTKLVCTQITKLSTELMFTLSFQEWERSFTYLHCWFQIVHLVVINANANVFNNTDRPCHMYRTWNLSWWNN